MAVEIIPSVLAHTPNELAKRLKVAREISMIVHLDVIDGFFVSSRSVGATTIARLKTSSTIEMHLMTNNPARWLPVVLKLNIRRVIVHVELKRRLKDVIALYRAHRRSVILAINPRTPPSRLKPWVKSVQGILIMGVHPGKYHAPWQSSTPARIKTIHRRYPKMLIACDGGLNPDTMPQAIRAGAQRLVVGSYLAYHPHPKRAWLKLRQLAARVKK